MAGSPPTARTPTPSRRCSRRPAALDAVVHLAGIPSEASLPEELTSHVVTTAALLDAMVRHGVTPDRLRQQQPRRRPHPARRRRPARHRRPAAARHVLRRREGRRRGTAQPVRRPLRHRRRRHPDRQLPAAAGERPRPVHLALPRRRGPDGRRLPHRPRPRLRGALRRLREHPRLVGPGPGPALGYHPQDDAERYADVVQPADGDDAEAAHVGGPFATRQFERPALD